MSRRNTAARPDRIPHRSLRAGRKRDATPKIAAPIAHKARQIKDLDTRSITRAAGRRMAGLREAAGRLWLGISQRLSKHSGEGCRTALPPSRRALGTLLRMRMDL